MSVRRADSRPLSTPVPLTPSAPPARRNAVATPVRTGDTFDSAAAVKLPLAQTGSAPFTRPTQGAWTQDVHTGLRSDPVTIYVHGNLSDLEGTLTRAGWSKADPQGLSASVHYAGAAVKQEALNALTYAANRLRGVEIGLAGVFGRHIDPAPVKAPHVAGVDRMPVSAQTVDGKRLVSAFECNNNPLGGRDHLRIFDTGKRDANGLPVYEIAASRDAGIRFAPDHPETGFMFHTVEADVGPERDKVLRLLTASGNATDVQRFTVPFGAPSSIGERVPDSTAYELTLRGPKLSAQLPLGRV